MLKKLRRRFILITMSLVAVVLIAVLTTSVVTNFQAQYNRIQNALDTALGSGGTGGWFWIGPPQNNPYYNRDIFGDTARNPQSDSQRSPGVSENYTDIPVFVITRNERTGEVVSNDNAVSMDAELLAEALKRIDDLTAADRIVLPKQSGGILLDIGLFYQSTRTNTPFGVETRIAFANSTPLVTMTLRQIGVSFVILALALLALFGISLLLSRFALRPVEEAWQKQRRFVADASHELKTPLTVILANNNLLRSHAHLTVAEQMQWVDNTQLEAQRMDGLVRDLLLLAQTDEQIELGRKTTSVETSKSASRRAALKNALTRRLKRAPVPVGLSKRVTASIFEVSRIDMSALVHRSMLQFDAVFFEREVTIESAVSSSIFVNGRAEQLDRMVSVLFDNASKYSDRHGVVYVSLDTLRNQKGAACVRLTVTNGGAPINAEKLPHLFDRFYRVDETRSDSVEGYGLGLSLARNIVEAHKGSIEVTSTAEEGTTFTVVLPQA